MKRILIFISFTLITIIGLLVISLSIRTDLSDFLAKNDPVDANLLIIDGWLPETGVEMVIKEAKKNNYNLIIPVGVNSSETDYCLMGMNGYLIFYPGLDLSVNEDYANHIIEVLVHSEMGGKYSTHCNFFVNDSLVTDFIVGMKPEKIAIHWKGSLKDIDSLMVNFDNDYLDENGDRNLYVREIIIDNKTVIPYQFHSIFDKGSLGGKDRIVSNYKSHPEILRNKLINSGIDSLKVFPITGKRTNINRTLTSALAFRKWLKSSGIKVSGINIITVSIHARRTWMTYRRVLDKSYKIGIISLPDLDNSASKKSRYLKTLTETLDLIYYWIILIPI